MKMSQKQVPQKQINHLCKMVVNHSGVYDTRTYRYYIKRFMDIEVLVRVHRERIGDTTYYGTEEEIIGQYKKEA